MLESLLHVSFVRLKLFIWARGEFYLDILELLVVAMVILEYIFSLRDVSELRMEIACIIISSGSHAPNLVDLDFGVVVKP